MKIQNDLVLKLHKAVLISDKCKITESTKYLLARYPTVE